MALRQCPWLPFRCPHFDPESCTRETGRQCMYVLGSRALALTLRAAYSSSGIGPAVRTVEDLVLRLGGAPEQTPELEALRRLSQRETEVVRACLEGQTTARMAQTLHISPHTVRNHLKAIFKKLGVRSRSELFRRFSTIAQVSVPDAPGGGVRDPDAPEE